MRQVNAVVYRWRWLLWAPWGVAVWFVLGWLAEPAWGWWRSWWQPNGSLDLIWYYWTAERFNLFPSRHEGLISVLWLGRWVDTWTNAWRYWVGAAVYVSFFFAASIELALPGLSLRKRRGRIESTHSAPSTERPALRRPTRRALLGASFLAAALSVGFIQAFSEHFPKVLHHLWISAAPHIQARILDEPRRWVGPCLLAGLWLCWAWCLQWFWRRGEAYWRLEGMTRWLVIGSICLLLYAGHVYWFTPTHRGFSGDHAYSALVLGMSVLLAAWAARVLLLHVLRAYDKARESFTECFACGYDLRGTLAAQRTACPECGAPVRHPITKPPIDGRADSPTVTAKSET